MQLSLPVNGRTDWEDKRRNDQTTTASRKSHALLFIHCSLLPRVVAGMRTVANLKGEKGLAAEMAPISTDSILLASCIVQFLVGCKLVPAQSVY